MVQAAGFSTTRPQSQAAHALLSLPMPNTKWHHKRTQEWHHKGLQGQKIAMPSPQTPWCYWLTDMYAHTHRVHIHRFVPCARCLRSIEAWEAQQCSAVVNCEPWQPWVLKLWSVSDGDREPMSQNRRRYNHTLIANSIFPFSFSIDTHDTSVISHTKTISWRHVSFQWVDRWVC